MTADEAKREQVRSTIADALVGLEPLFKHHKLTFVARNTNPDAGDCDFIVSAESDNLEAVASVLLDHAHRNAPYVCPGCHAVGGEKCAPGCIDAEMEAEREHERTYGGFTERYDDDEEDL